MSASGPSSPASSNDRNGLIEDLRGRGISDEKVLQAIARVPREEFVPSTFRNRAYADDALPIGCHQTISQPYTVAAMTELLHASRGMSVLEVGTGSGYQAAVLATMGLRVFTIERYPELLAEARKRLARIGINVASHLGDGSLGWSTYAPYDRIIVTAGAPHVPAPLLRQLAPNGLMVIPVGDAESQTMKVVTRVADSDQFDTRDAGRFKFVPLIGRSGWDTDPRDRGLEGLPGPGETKWYR